ncbi:MAG: MBL fold metallo-hydrolase [Desulfurococcales archaeon]|nr:MBL fold metallo-hydrolase [Desulfurococcales archaeon]
MNGHLRVEVARFTLSPLRSNCYVISSNREAVVIDPGWRQGLESVIEYIDSNGLRVTGIIATHGHFDHVMGVNALREATGAGFKIHELDVGLIEVSARRAEELLGLKLEEPPEPDGTLREGDKIRVGSVELEVIHTPGHTRGSITLVWDKLAFTGDTLFKGTIGRIDLPESSPKKMEESLRKLLQLSLQTTIYPGHGPPTTVTEEKAQNPFLARIARGEPLA